MAERKVTIAIDMVVGPNAGAKVKSALSDVEREAKASQKRVEANSKATDRAIYASSKANAEAEKRQAKLKADEFIRQIKRVERERREAEAAAKKSGGLMGAVFAGSFAGNVASQGLSLLTSQLQRAGAAVFEFSSKMEQSRVAFSTLMGDSRRAAQHIRELQELTVKFPLDFTAISSLSQRLQGAGIEAAKVIPLIKDIGNVAAATGTLSAERMEGIGVALSQIASKGKVSAEEMEQLAERGVPAWKLLSEAIGKTTGEVRKLAEDGQISSDQLFAAFQRLSRVKFGDAMKNQAKTFSGAMKQIENVLMLTAATAFEPFYKKISALAGETSKLVQQQKGSFIGVGNVIGEAIGKGVSIAITETMRNLPALIWTMIRATASSYMDLPKQLAGMMIGGAYDAKNWLGSKTGMWGSSQLPPEYYKMFGGSPAQNATSAVTTPNYARPGDRRPAAPNVLNTGGGMMMPKVKSSKTNINLKSDMADALNIAARYGLTVTSGKDGKHNTGSAHGSGGAFDIRTNGMPPAVIEAARRALEEAGYYVKDDRTRPTGQKVWGGPHMHVGGRKPGGKAAVFNPQAVQEEITARLRDESDAKTKAYQDEIVDSFISVYNKTGLLPTGAMLDRIQDRMGEIAAMQGHRQPNTADIQRHLDRIKGERLARRMPSVSDESGLGIGTQLLGTQALELLPTNPLEEKARKANEEFWNDWRDEQQRAFDDAARSWEDLLTDLANGDFKSIWRNLKNSMIQQFIQPMSQSLAGMFGGVGGGQGGFGSMLGGMFGGGSSMGPGGTPMFNGFSGGSGGGGIGSMFSGLFGGGSSGAVGSSGMEPGIGRSLGLPGGGMFSTGGKGLGGMMRGMGGGSMLAGAAGMGGMAATMIGGALGGKWGNMLSMAGMGVSIGANFGPWGALIGGAIGAGAGLISMLFGRDDAEKKLKQAAISQFGITVKDKSVLKSLKALGETMFGKGKVGANAGAVISSDQGQLILRNYAEASGQSSKKIDQLYYGDETWSGNQFNSKFGGFRAMGGPVSGGTSYIVGERGPELFTPTASGSITPNGGGNLEKVVAQLEETLYSFMERIGTMKEGVLVARGLDQNPEAAVHATNKFSDMSFGYGERSLKAQGVW